MKGPAPDKVFEPRPFRLWGTERTGVQGHRQEHWSEWNLGSDAAPSSAVQCPQPEAEAPGRGKGKSRGGEAQPSSPGAGLWSTARSPAATPPLMERLAPDLTALQGPGGCVVCQHFIFSSPPTPAQQAWEGLVTPPPFLGFVLQQVTGPRSYSPEPGHQTSRCQEES